MPATPRFDLRRLCLSLGALGAGLLLGSQLRHYTVGTATGAAAESVQRTTVRTGHDTGVESAPGRPGVRPPRVVPDSLSFSRHQWSKMLRHKESFCVPLDSYLPVGDETDAVPIFEDIPIIGRLFRPPMPKSLKEAAALFGWDEKQLENVEVALTKFGRELAAAEQNGTRIDYPNSGGLRFDFSACQTAREAVVAQFKQALDRSVGTRDAERFGLLSKLEGLAAPLPDHYEITASYEGESVVVRAPGVLEIHELHATGAPVDFSSFAGQGLDGRIRHLSLEVYWLATSTTSSVSGPGHRNSNRARWRSM